jgi:protein transport protein SEC31
MFNMHFSFHSLHDDQLGDFVTSSDPVKWHETLAAICSYGTQEEFTPLCEALGDRLESVGDLANASLCYMCALNLEKASKFWQMQLDNGSNVS